MTLPPASTLLKVLPAAALMSLISLVMSFSFAAMMVHSSHPSLLPDLVKGLLFTATLSALILAWQGSLKGLIAIPLPSAAAMFADLFQRTQPSAEMLWTLLLTGSLLTALLMLLLGWLKLSKLVRYLPLPVLAGFLAGVGWLFIKGGLALVGLQTLTLDVLNNTALWIGLGITLTLWLLKNIIKPAHLLPLVTLVGSLLLVFLAPFLDTQNTWFFELEAAGQLPLTAWQWTQNGLPDINWLDLSWDILTTLAVIATLSMLLQATSIELLAKQDLDLNKELKVAGSFNIINALAGGSLGSLSLSQTSMVRQMQAATRLTGVLMALFLTLGYFFHDLLIQWLPLPLVAGILMFQGVQFVHQWLLSAHKRFPRSDQLVIAIIFVTILLQGFLPGVLLGLLLTVILFIREYSRLQVVQLKTNLKGLSSNVERSPNEQEWLDQQANQVRIYQLKGFLFFGTANTLVEEIRQDVLKAEEPIKTLLLDMQRVVNADTSTGNSLTRLKQFCDKAGIEIHLSALNKALEKRFTAVGLPIKDHFWPGHLLLHKSQEKALEFIENKLIKDLQKESPANAYQLLKEKLKLNNKQANRLVDYFTRIPFKDREWIIKQGMQDSHLYLIFTGQVEVLLERPDQPMLRLKKMRPGTLLGEMGLYTGQPRAASARAIGDVELLAINAANLELMEARDPDMALSFHRHVVQLQSERLQESNLRLNNILQS
ncbi:Sulfate permease, MFS superfamily [Marinospirillum celere]|uniref:Sulfate permease, MFS superfamily n=1 Tax=Marinospirillum celere TaxID=1122252 RepID=A0A1I1HAQ2_9GAMM|nr:SulP family inorganic anion transporter [Marinospirillum celere]SFC18573.1 Sulfate permease, MFS superfamily [Marinospirillum celere]